jgi:pre-rRNA-processing protein TSR4
MDVDDDDSDEDGARALASARPTLCYPGRLTSRRESRAFADAGARGAHKVGGAPVALTADGDDDGDDGDDDGDAATRWYAPRCASCARAMTLVVQTYAPRGGRGRALYAYACVGGGAACRGDDAWACVSATSIAARADASEERGRDGETATRDGGGSRARATNGVETYGTAERAPAMEDAWDDPESSAWCDDGADAAALSAELDAMLACGVGCAEGRAEAAMTPGDEDEDDGDGDDDAARQEDGFSLSRIVREAYDAACATQIVEYHLVSEIEPKAVSGMTVKEAAHAEALLARYAEREGVSVTDVVAIDDEDGEWAGETYERGEARHADDAYLKFARRLQRAPDQCMRYDVGGMKFIWPTKTPPPSTSCDRCGTTRVCELQLTPALLRDVEDALSMHKGDKSRLASEEDLLGWDWQTVCVFACPNDACVVPSTDVHRNVSYALERVFVAESEAPGDALLKATRAS